MNKARMQRKCVRGLELGLKSHSEKKNSGNVTPARLWIKPLMYSDVSELVLTGFFEPVYIRQILTGGGAGLVIYHGASRVYLSKCVYTQFASTPAVPNKGIIQFPFLSKK